MKQSLFLLLLTITVGTVSAKADNITFADANVKALCVGNWDANYDGELSTEEAAAVTSSPAQQGNTPCAGDSI